ncbi:PREDICTED: uncharacterized protein LOC106809098 [Priapulus caudatus]|uniref:Uncharacterized protein LOC106809098 n=1 Tax=Priapulus caudatus TaxID=37621 RepID=A0ABM1E5S2_PRICU|nr:PREDICTED: uncharacterized protein LOC106809098 [Priapulus caudatus]
MSGQSNRFDEFISLRTSSLRSSVTTIRHGYPHTADDIAISKMAAKDAPEDKSTGLRVGLALGFFMAVAAGFLMVTVGFSLLWIRFAKPYLRTDDFLETKCTVIRSQLDGEYTCCTNRCQRLLRYPCVTISVSYNITTTNTTERGAARVEGTCTRDEPHLRAVRTSNVCYSFRLTSTVGQPDEFLCRRFKVQVTGTCFFGYNQKCLKRHNNIFDKLKASLEQAERVLVQEAGTSRKPWPQQLLASWILFEYGCYVKAE